MSIIKKDDAGNITLFPEDYKEVETKVEGTKAKTETKKEHKAK